ncbi:Pyridoxamine 5'-phosphate oxidase [Lentzea fradiae]|uniref:Pyridoxamine 5'-phosphate oxidase n=1 Tax=Lentzea fradiae TaxID=200378 RepID=A0A1G7KDV8_9PSEU|nr:pyridoxamine 5'-phosphate oxidase family protein [Lentzea fradiae]SDF35383.1 Pyridoxamine 5'-phosphate oxidase [Lentzea fradiae]
MTSARELTNGECWDVLGRVGIGRLLHTSGGLPVAPLVPFVMRNKVIMASLDGDTAAKVVPAGAEFVAFQADDLSAGGRSCHSVTVYGRARVVSSRRRACAEMAGLPRYDGRAVYVCVAPVQLNGSYVDFG